MATKKMNFIYKFCLYLLTLSALTLYLFYRYETTDSPLEGLSFKCSVEKHHIVAYAKTGDETDFNFKEVYTPIQVNGAYIFSFNNKQVRSLRIYPDRKTQKDRLSDITLHYRNGTTTMGLQQFKTINLKIETTANGTHLVSGDPDGYFELKKTKTGTVQFYMALLLLPFLSLALCVLFHYCWRQYHNILQGLQQAFVSLFLFSIFLPHPFFNVLFVLSFLLVIRNFSLQRLKANKIGLLFIFYFCIFLINGILVSSSFNNKFFETLAPLLLLPLYIACVPPVNYLRLFPISALLIGACFFTTSCIDASVHQNLAFFSFYNFSKYAHPVYFSYLLFFSLIYLEYTAYEGFNRVLFLSTLVVFLICSGSKLIIVLALVFYGVQSWKKNKLVFAALTLLILLTLLFAPTRKRFYEMASVKSFGILYEEKLKSPNDEQLTGLTLRLVLWRETFALLNKPQYVLFGRGSDAFAAKLLEERLLVRGLEKGLAKYDPHNQFLTTFYKTGLIGMLALIVIVVWGFYEAAKQHNSLLLFSVVLFCTAMMAESVLQRVVGIYFFTSMLLLQTSAFSPAALHKTALPQGI